MPILTNLQASIDGSGSVLDSVPVTNVSNVILPCSIPGHSTTNVNYLSNTYSGSVVSVAMIVPSTQSIQTMSTSFPLLVNSLVIYSVPLTQTMWDVSFFNNPLLSPSTQLIQSLIFFCQSVTSYVSHANRHWLITILPFHSLNHYLQ